MKNFMSVKQLPAFNQKYSFNVHDFVLVILLLLSVLYFSIPKINIVAINQFGIRPLDFFSLIMGIVLMSQFKFKHRTLLFWMSIILLECIIGLIYSGPIGIIYIVRFMQYMLVGFSLYIVLKSKYRSYFIVWLLLIQFIYCLLQYLAIIPNFDPGRSHYIRYGSFSGSFGTPAELSYFIVLIFGLYLYVSIKFKVVLAYILSVNSVLFAPILLFIPNLRKVINIFNQRIILLLSYLSLFLLLGLVFDFNTITDLILNPVDNREILTKGGNLGAIDTSNIEHVSLVMRLSKFLSVYYYMFSNNNILLFGCGYGCGNGAIDSGIIRFLLEFGLIGFFVLFVFITKIPAMPLVVILGVNFLFDGLWSSATAPLILSFIFIHNYNKVNKYVYSK